MVWLWLLPLMAMAWAQPAVTPGWVRLVPPVVKDTTAYLTLENRGDKSIRLVGADADVPKWFPSIRTTGETRGGQVVLGMRPLPHLDIPPKRQGGVPPGRIPPDAGRA